MARKADTEGWEREAMKMPAFIAVLLVVGVLVVSGAIYIGKSDEGQIDVAGTISRSNQAIVDGGGDQSGQVDVVPQAFQDMPNGGLVPQENQRTEPIEQPATDVVTGTTTADATEVPPSDASTTTDSVPTE